MINKKSYPLFFLKDVKLLFQQVRQVAEENNDILEITKNEPMEIIIKDSAKDSDFEFTVFNPQRDVNKVKYTIQFNPTNSQKLDIHKNTTTPEEVVRLLNHWIGLIKEYNLIDLTPEERILNKYEDEFYDSFETYEEFEIIDEGADVDPYDLRTQLKIDTFLSNAIHILKQDEEENKLLIEEAIELKNDLPRLTKKGTVKKLSKLFAKVRQKSLTLLKEFIEEAKKELFKRMIDGSFESLGKYIDEA